MIPKLNFVFSQIYNEILTAHLSDELKSMTQEYASEEIMNKYIDEIKSIWKKEGNKTLKSISSISGLNWKENLLKVYLVTFNIPFSDPLTLPAYEDKSYFKAVLIHELIHQIEIQDYKVNPFKWKKWIDYLQINYKKENIVTKGHILIYAIMTKLFIDNNSPDLLKLYKKLDKKDNSNEYGRAWNIVDSVGYNNLISKFKELMK